MADPAGEADSATLRLDFDRRVMLRFHGSAITSDGGLLAYRELDDVLALTTSGGDRLAEARTGKNRRRLLVGLLRQSVFGRLAGYEDVNDADRLCRDPAMRWVVGGAVVADQPAGEADQDRRQGGQPRPLRHLPDGRGLGAAADVPGHPVADRPAPRTAGRSITERSGQMRQSTTSKVRLAQGKTTSFGAAEAGNATIWLPTGDCDRIWLRRTSTETEDLAQRLRYPGNVG
jgi:hypothetical protein